MFPSLNPILMRQTKAREVFLLFRRTEILNKQIKEQEKKEKESKNSVSNNQRVDVTGLDNGWY